MLITERMKLPILWLNDYVAFTTEDLAAACRRWGLDPAQDEAQTLGTLFTFAGFACDGVVGHGDEAVLELDVLSNRPDCLCVLGLARELAAVLKVSLKIPTCETTSSGPAVAELAKVRVEDEKTCPRYLARVIRGVQVKPSPLWLQARLKLIGLTPRNNIVDVTNFILFELNHPLHAFDLGKLVGQQIVVRRAKDQEAFKPLYGEIPPLTSETLVIADAEHPVAVAGVIGGVGSEVDESTTDIFLEAACFAPPSIRRACRRLKVSTDASYRFERGVDEEGVERASARAAQLIVELAGGIVAAGHIDVRAPRLPATKTALGEERITVALRMSRLHQLMGTTSLHAQEVKQILNALGCEVLPLAEQEFLVKIPSWRQGDLRREADLIEDIVRLHGYHHVPAATSMSARIAPRSSLESASDRIRELFTSLGYFEAVSDSLIHPLWPTPPVWTAEKPLALNKQSVLREDHSSLRNSLLVSLLDIQRLNQDRRTGTVRLFECGKVFLPQPGCARPEERAVLGVLDELGFQHLADALSRVSECLGLTGVRLVLRTAAQVVSSRGTHARATPSPDFLVPETACRVVCLRGTSDHECTEEAIGWLGIVAPKLAQAFDLKKAPAIAELDLGVLAAVATAPRSYVPLPTQPENARDVAMVVDESVAWNDIETYTTSYAAHEPLRDQGEAVRFLSVYRGKQLGAGKKSVAFGVIYRAPERSLSDEEVNAAHQHFVAELLKTFKAELRK